MRGMSLLQSCDVLVYDDLISPELLTAAPDSAEKIYMGKRMGRHSAPQEAISAVLIAKAQAGNTVVRLKGGDPFVFGRGGEEILALQAAGIPYESVPGISSTIAIPAAAGIPVTHRGLSQSFHVVTAHTAGSGDGLPAYMEDLAHLPGTLIFLMGLSRLEAIVRRLISAGMPPDTPAAVISGGNAATPSAVRGNLENIAHRTRAVKLQPPAVIVVGATASLNIPSTILKPLTGLCVGLTGTDAVTSRLRPALREAGARVFDAERSVVQEISLRFDLRTLCGGKPRWLVFTSRNGVRLFFQTLRRQKVDLRELHACRFAVIGAATAEQLEAYGVQADLCPAVYTGEELARELCRTVERNAQIFLLRSARGSRALFETLAKVYNVRDIPIYDLRPDSNITEAARPCLNTADYLTFSSASGVELFFEAHGSIPDKATCICIGAVTAKALEARYQKPFLIAPEISAEGILQAILQRET